MIKNLLLCSTFVFLLGNLVFSQGTLATRTSITNGNANNPFTWDCTCVPVPGDNIIINHAVTLNVDFAYTSGSVTVNNSASLTGDIPTRAFAFTGGSFTNSGNVTLGDFYHGGGTFNNSGFFDIGNAYAVDLTANSINSGTFVVSDTLYVNTNASFTNSGYLQANHIATAGTITNTGEISGTDIFNSGTLNNNGGLGISMINLYSSGTVVNGAKMDLTYDLWNNENFTNINHLVVGRNLFNGDTLLGTASITNNGTISVGNDLTNSLIMNGTGDYCIANVSTNTGTVSGTLDICDLTGTNFDTNFGSVAGSVTFCSAGTCMIAVEEDMKINKYTLFPNPFTNAFTIDMKTSGNYKLILLNSVGQIIYEYSFSGTQKNIDLSSQARGIYHYRIVGGNSVLSGRVVKE